MSGMQSEGSSGGSDHILKVLVNQGKRLDSNCNGKSLDELKQGSYLMNVLKMWSKD